MRRRRLLLVAALTALIGCGVPRDSEPRVVKDADVPFGLLTTTSAASSTVPG